MMLPKLDTFVLLTNEGPSLDKKDEPWNNFKHGDDGMRKGIQNGVTRINLLLTLLVFNDIRKSLNEFNPFSMSMVQFF